MAQRQPYKKKHKWSIDEFLDSARDHLGHMIDNIGIRDLVYVTCWISGTILIYNTASGIKEKILISPIEFLTRSFTPFWMKGEGKAALDGIDWNIFMLAMIGSYTLLKIDVGDVNAAIGKLQAAITITAATL